MSMDSLTENPATGGAHDLTTATSSKFDRRHGAQFLANIEVHAPWEAWAAKLAHLKRPLSLRKLIDSPENPLEWAMSSSMDDDALERVRQLDRLKRHATRNEPADWSALVQDWISQAAHREPSESFAIECLAWTHALSRLAIRLPAESWWDTFAFLLNTAVEATQSFDANAEAGEQAVLSQLFAGELALTLAYCLPRVEVCAGMAGEAREAISEGIVELLDGEGVPSRSIHAVLAIAICIVDKVHVSGSLRPARSPEEESPAAI